jgi:transporter family protein
MANWVILLCSIIWGFTTFLNKISVDKMSPLLMQIIVGICYIIFIPIAVRLSGGISNIKWSTQSVLITVFCTILSIFANTALYFSLKGNNHAGRSSMIISLYPVITLLLSVIFLKECITLTKLIGIILMIMGAIILNAF